MRRAALLLPVAVVLLAGCTGTFPRPPELDPAVATAYGNLYVRQQTLLGRTGVTVRGTGASAACERGGPGVLDQGAGDDWACVISYTGANGRPRTVRYELTVTPDGCYRADGPPGTVGEARIPLPDGSTAYNRSTASTAVSSPDRPAAIAGAGAFRPPPDSR